MTVMFTFPRRAFEIGQPFSPFSAAAWKPAWSRPGTTPVTVRAESLTSTPPPSLALSDTTAVTCSRSGGVPSLVRELEKAMA